ncbi:MAG: hypothetical protein Q8928_02535 [Bacteroidota bacterium]|nr:hypothetical protein [Bacteroidota bacterium]
MIKIKFLKSAVEIGYAYCAGQIADVPEEMGIHLIDLGYTEKVKE